MKKKESVIVYILPNVIKGFLTFIPMCNARWYHLFLCCWVKSLNTQKLSTQQNNSDFCLDLIFSQCDHVTLSNNYLLSICFLYFAILRLCSVYGEPIPVKELAERVASYVHLCTLYWWLRFITASDQILKVSFCLTAFYMWS